MSLLVFFSADGALLVVRVLHVVVILAASAEHQMPARLDHHLLPLVQAHYAQHLFWYTSSRGRGVSSRLSRRSLLS